MENESETDPIPDYFGRAELAIMGLPKRGKKQSEEPVTNEFIHRTLFNEEYDSAENISDDDPDEFSDYSELDDSDNGEDDNNCNNDEEDDDDGGREMDSPEYNCHLYRR